MDVFKWKVPFFKPRFGDCTHHLNCHLRRFKPSFVPFRKADIPGQFYIGDIDGVLALENGNTLFLEFKTDGVQVAKRQMTAYSVLSAKEGQDALIVWHKAGAVDDAVRCQFISEGKKRRPETLANGHQGLVDVLRAWAYNQEPPKDVRATSAELARIKLERENLSAELTRIELERENLRAKLTRIELERENLIYHVFFCLDEICARQEGRYLDIPWIKNSAREARTIDWRFFRLWRIDEMMSYGEPGMHEDRVDTRHLATKAELQSVKAELRIHRWLLGLVLIGLVLISLYGPMLLEWSASLA